MTNLADEIFVPVIRMIVAHEAAHLAKALHQRLVIEPVAEFLAVSVHRVAAHRGEHSMGQHRRIARCRQLPGVPGVSHVESLVAPQVRGEAFLA